MDGSGFEDELLERRLYLARKRAGKLVRKNFGQKGEDFYVAALSCRTICYKGMFMAWQLFAYYPDLADDRLSSALAIVHQRYSTNTFPSWQLAQPLRCVAHNGEINTLNGNCTTPASLAITTKPSVVASQRQGLRPFRSSVPPTILPSVNSMAAGPSHGSIMEA